MERHEIDALTLLILVAWALVALIWGKTVETFLEKADSFANKTFDEMMVVAVIFCIGIPVEVVTRIKKWLRSGTALDDIQGWLWYIFWFLATGKPITMMYHRIKDKLRNT